MKQENTRHLLGIQSLFQAWDSQDIATEPTHDHQGKYSNLWPSSSMNVGNCRKSMQMEEKMSSGMERKSSVHSREFAFLFTAWHKWHARMTRSHCWATLFSLMANANVRRSRMKHFIKLA